MAFPESLFVIVGITTVVWIGVTFATRPVEEAHLLAFYRRVHPGGVGWKHIQLLLPDVTGDSDHGVLFTSWLAGVVLIYSALFGVGSLILGDHAVALVYGVVAAIAIWWLNRQMSRIRLIA
jgi:hypothetical protein